MPIPRRRYLTWFFFVLSAFNAPPLIAFDSLQVPSPPAPFSRFASTFQPPHA